MLSDTFWPAVIGSLTFGFIGVVLLIVGFKLFDLVVRGVDFEEELKKGNVSVAVVVSSFLLAIAYVVAHVVK